MSGPIVWFEDQADVNWRDLEALYRSASLGNKTADDLREVFTNSRFKLFVYDGDDLVGAGRALADGLDCSYICDVAIAPSHQRIGLGTMVVSRLLGMSKGHRKIVLYAAPGKEEFYRKLGFSRMRTAMALFHNQHDAMKRGLVE